MKKIMLCCNAGMSTSLLVQKMQAEVANRGLDIEVEARPMNEAHDYLASATCCCLVRRSDTPRPILRRRSPVVSVEVINMVDYGRMNAAGIIDHCVSVMG